MKTPKKAGRTPQSPKSKTTTVTTSHDASKDKDEWGLMNEADEIRLQLVNSILVCDTVHLNVLQENTRDAGADELRERLERMEATYYTLGIKLPRLAKKLASIEQMRHEARRERESAEEARKAAESPRPVLN